jgi:hypothetical protein
MGDNGGDLRRRNANGDGDNVSSISSIEKFEHTTSLL